MSKYIVSVHVKNKSNSLILHVETAVDEYPKTASLSDVVSNVVDVIAPDLEVESITVRSTDG
jgi:ABC-type sulfate transport system permease subunit